jgi:biotin synthase
MKLSRLLSGEIRHDWTQSEIQHIFNLPFNDLMFAAQTLHRKHFNPNHVQTSTLLSIKTGACPEDCKYCPQSGHYNTGLSKEQLMQLEQVIEEAKRAKETGASRFCMGAAWKSPREKDFVVVLEMIKQVKSMGLETCVTLGMLDDDQATRLKDAGLDYYNHNLDTSEEYYEQIITTRTFQDRLDTLDHVRGAGINVCAGGILGLGESEADRFGLLKALANLPEHPQSVPINQLVAVKGTPLEDAEALDPFDFIRTIATARIMMPKSYVRLSAGREDMNEQTQAMCFMAGANSIFYGDKLLTTANPEENKDRQLLAKLGMNTEISANKPQDNHSGIQDLEQLVAQNQQDQQTSKPLYYDASIA